MRRESIIEMQPGYATHAKAERARKDCRRILGNWQIAERDGAFWLQVTTRRPYTELPYYRAGFPRRAFAVTRA